MILALENWWYKLKQKQNNSFTSEKMRHFGNGQKKHLLRFLSKNKKI